MYKKKIETGDYVKVVKTIFSDLEWSGIGRVDVPFKVGDTVQVTRISTGYQINKGSVYPVSGFIPINNCFYEIY